MSEVKFKGIKPKSETGKVFELISDEWHALLICMLNFSWEEWGQVIENGQNVCNDNFRTIIPKMDDAALQLASSLESVVMSEQYSEFSLWYVNESGYCCFDTTDQKNEYRINMMVNTKQFIEFLQECGGSREVK